MVGPDDAYRMVVITSGTQKGRGHAPPGTPVPLYADSQLVKPPSTFTTAPVT